MVRYLIVGFLLTIGLVGAQLYRSQSNQDTQQSVQQTMQKIKQEPIQKVDSTTIESLDLALISDEKSTESSAPMQTIATQSQTIRNFQPPDLPSIPWQTDESPPKTPARYMNRGIDVRPLKINKQHLADISMGDTVSLPIPQNGQNYEMSVKEVGRHINGDKSLKGFLVSNPEYTVVMTEGRNATFATINTPDGSFLLEASGNEGWMMSLAELDSLVDPNLVDYQVPEINRQEQ